MELEEYSFPEDLIAEHHKSTEYKNMIDALEEGVKDEVIEDYLVSEELNVHMQDMFNEYNESAEVQQLIESTVNASLANETKEVEEKRDDDISKAKETDLKTLDLIEELVLKLHKVYSEESRTYRSERYAKSYLSTKHLKNINVRPQSEEKGDSTGRSRLFTTDSNKYFNWNYERDYTFPNNEGLRIQDSPMNPNLNYGPEQAYQRPGADQNPALRGGGIKDIKNEKTFGNAPAPNWDQVTVKMGNAPNYGYAPAPNWGQYTVQMGNAPKYGNAPVLNWDKGQGTPEPTFTSTPYHDIESVTRIAPESGNIHIFIDKWANSNADHTTEQFWAIAPNPFYNNNNNNGRQLPPKANKENVLINKGGNAETEVEGSGSRSFDISRIKEFNGPDEDQQENLPKKNPGIDINIKKGVLARFQQARQVTQAPDRLDVPNKTEKMERNNEPKKEEKFDATTLWIPVSSPFK